jgi:predicted lipid-binding transport protein (Tim44 family)
VTTGSVTMTTVSTSHSSQTSTESSTTSSQEISQTKTSSNNTGGIIGNVTQKNNLLIFVKGGVFGGLVVLGIIAFLIFRKMRKSKNSTSENISLNSRQSADPQQKMTIIKDIIVKNRLGGGHFSDVFKAEWQVPRIFLEFS